MFIIYAMLAFAFATWLYLVGVIAYDALVPQPDEEITNFQKKWIEVKHRIKFGISDFRARKQRRNLQVVEDLWQKELAWERMIAMKNQFANAIQRDLDKYDDFMDSWHSKAKYALVA